MDYRCESVYKKIRTNSALVTVPGSKSITARALLLSALARGESALTGAQFSDDCRTFIDCLKALGVPCEMEGDKLFIDGCEGVLPKSEAKINVGSAGTAARFLTVLLSFSDGVYEVDASDQMKARPMKPLLTSLEDAGVKFEYLGVEHSFPFVVRGTKDIKDEIKIDVTKSSQYLSAYLMCAPTLGKQVKINLAGSHGSGYVDMTLDMMWTYGVSVRRYKKSFAVKPGFYVGKQYEVEPDVSAACYFYAANKILGTDIKVRGLMPHSMQSDAAFIELLKTFQGGEVDMSSFSDQALTLAAVAPFLKNPTTMTGIGHIREQECDRIHAMTYNLSNLGIKTEETENSVTIYPGAPKGCEIESFGDHRVAMAFAVLGLRCEGVVIKNADVCSKTFKEYFDVIDGMTDEMTR
ncbi:MAG: 3-phosphoshikimate 1-carboxyvinyltransferase [Clostridia bacterium]|nr:3-phosphoshikimate 1-carboxyvinyltransferase [Clostridia bacterium]